MLCSQCGMYYPCVTAGETGTTCITCATPMQYSSEDFLGNSPIRIAKEIRQPQISLAERVELAIQLKQMLVAQAGTGTGKTFALLLPAILSGKVVVVSTATVTLQSQYLQELAFLHTTLAKYNIPFSYAQKKGRGHYLCPVAYQKNRHTYEVYAQGEDTRTQTTDATEAFKAFDDWVKKTTYGDKAELMMNKMEIPRWWSDVNAKDCVGTACPKAETCGRMIANEDARVARVVIANHSIIGFNLKLGMKLLPPHSVCFFDEAHKAPAMLQKALANEMGQKATRHISNAFAGADFHRHLPVADELLEEIEAEHKELFDHLLREVGWASRRAGSNVTQIELQKHQIEESLMKIEEIGVRLQKMVVEFYKAILSAKKKMEKGIDPLGFPPEDEIRVICQRAEEAFPDDELEEVTLKKRVRYPSPELVALALYGLSNYLSTIAGLLRTGENDIIYLEVPESQRALPKICHSPIFIGEILQQEFYPKVPVVVSSSATIPFTWHKMEMGYPDAVQMFEAKSPFRYGSRVFIYTSSKVPVHPDRNYSVKNLPIPQRKVKKQEYFDVLAQEIADLCLASKGNAFVLFSAKTEMEELKARVAKLIPFPLKAQSEGTSPIGLEKWYRNTSNPVLFGLKSFWEGVDIPGDQLRLVILPKLPFPLQGDIVLNAKKRIMKQRGYDDTFALIDIPDMCMNVLQIFGRLIRTDKDYGVFAVLDRKFTEEWFHKPGSYSNKLYNLLPTSPDGKKMKVTSSMADIQQMFQVAGVK